MRRISPFIETRSIYIRRRLSKGQSACIFSALRNVDSWRISPFIETWSIYIRRRLSKGQSAPNLFCVTECGQLAHLTLYRDSEYIHTPSSLKRAISSESFPRYEVWMYVRKICGASHPLSRWGVYTYTVVSQKGNLLASFPRYEVWMYVRKIC